VKILQYRHTELFTVNDFKIFDIPEFNERMAAILTRIRPKLASIGKELAPLAGLFQIQEARVFA